jgi:hypothetical protein
MAKTPEQELLEAIQKLNTNVEGLARSVSSMPRSSATTPTGTTAGAAGAGTSGFNFEFDADKIGKDFGKLFNTISTGLKGAIEQAQGAFGSIVGQVTTLYEKIDNGRAEFLKQTGDFEKALPLYYKFAGAVRGLGVEYGDAARELAGLVNTYPGFIDLSEKEQLSLAKQSAALKRLGIDFTSTYPILKTVLGLTAEQSTKTATEIMSFAKALGVPPKIVTDDFTKAIPKLGLFGDKAVDVFKNSEAISKKFGISLDSILGMVDRFDTFESAADAAGNLNAVFRENLFDTQELLLATDPADKIKLFASRFEQYKNTTGKSFDDFDVFTKKAIAKQSGVDINTLSQISKMTGAQLADIQNNIKMNKDGTFEIEKAAAKTLTIQERMDALRDRVMSAFLPLLEKMQPILNKMADFAVMFGNGVSSLLKSSPGLTDALGGIASAMGAFSILERTGIPSVFGNMLSSITAFIPGADKLSGFVMPALGFGLAGLVANADKTGKGLKDTLKENLIFKQFNLDDKQLTMIEKSLNGVTSFVKNAFTNLLKFVGFNQEDIDGIIGNIKGFLSDSYTTLMEWVGNIKNIIFGDKEKSISGFLGAFLENMGSSTEKNPFLKLVQSVSKGLQEALKEISKLLTGSGGGGETNPIMKEFGDTLKEFTGTIKNVITSTFGDLFGEDGKGGFLFSFLDTITSSSIFKEFGKTFLETIGGVFKGLGSIFDAIGGGVDFAKIGTGISSFIGSFVGAFKENLGFFTGINNSEVAILGTAAAGIGKKGESFKDFNPKSVETVNAIIPVLKGIGENAKPIDSNFIESLNKFADALIKLNPALVELGKNKENLSVISDIPAERVRRMEDIATSVERYANAVQKTSALSSEQDKIKQVLGAIGGALANLKLDIEADKMGEVIGDKVANAIKTRLH